MCIGLLLFVSKTVTAVTWDFESEPQSKKHEDSRSTEKRILFFRHCQQLLVNLLTVLCHHNDHLTVSSILMHCKTEKVRIRSTVGFISY